MCTFAHLLQRDALNSYSESAETNDMLVIVNKKHPHYTKFYFNTSGKLIRETAERTDQEVTQGRRLTPLSAYDLDQVTGKPM